MKEKEIEKLLSNLKGRIKPSRELTQRILVDLDVTEKKDNSYILQGREKDRFSNYELILNQIHTFMIKWKMAIPVILVVLVVAGLMIIRSGQKIQPMSESAWEQSTEMEYVQTPKEILVPQATGNIDDIIDAMTAFAENEQVITIEEGNDASMVTIDSQAVSDFGQSYDENQF